MSDLSPKVSASVEKNWAVMLKNFGKISSWFKNGAESKHPLPPVLAEWLEEYGDLQELVGKLATGYNDQSKVIKELRDAIAGLEKAATDTKEVNGYLSKRIDDLEKQLADLDAPAFLTDTSDSDADAEETAKANKAAKAKADKAAKAKADKAKADKAANAAKAKKEEKKDELDLTAEAIDAGDVSPEAIAALDDMAQDLQADLEELDEL